MLLDLEGTPWLQSESSGKLFSGMLLSVGTEVSWQSAVFTRGTFSKMSSKLQKETYIFGVQNEQLICSNTNNAILDNFHVILW